jgi:hypothetical protein
MATGHDVKGAPGGVLLFLNMRVAGLPDHVLGPFKKEGEEEEEEDRDNKVKEEK